MKNTGLFPFSELKLFLEVDIDNYLKKFYKLYENEEFAQKIKSINKETFQIEIYKDYYKNNESATKIIDFQDQIKTRLVEKVDDSISSIVNSVEERATYGASISPYLIRIIKQYDELLEIPAYSNFSFIPNYINLIKSSIERYSLPDKIGEDGEIYKYSPFSVSDNFRRLFFIELYYIATRNNVIDSEKCSKEQFIEVFTADNTELELQFICKGQEMISFIETIGPVFKNFTRKAIEESKRFVTKSKNRKVFLTKTNYDSIINRMQPKSSEMLELEEEISELISNHSK